jgi:signal transduction histidine kinase
VSGPDPGELARVTRRLERERAARREAEAIAERVTGQLYDSVRELKRLNRDIERANDELAAANQTLKDFVAVAAHDLRGPVSAILGFAQTILGRWATLPDDEKREFLGIVEGRARYMTRMLDSLLTVSRIESGAIDVHRETLSVSDAIRDALQDVERASEATITCPPGLEVMADPDHFRRILSNYVTNAFKYGEPPVVIEARDDGQHVEIIVSDHGDGVPPSFASRLFHKFARAEGDRIAEAGSGLGLSIVQGLARANDGDAWYTPNEPKGSRFAVRLPKVA